VDFANKLTELLKSPATREKYGQESKRLASQYTEYLQTKRLEDIYKESLR
jgi:glycosyltransferase involved in cell wall biosynthesis